MAETRVSQNKWEINRYNEIIDDISEYIAKSKALTDMALKSDLNNISAETLYHYFWELSSLIQAIETVFNDLE